VCISTKILGCIPACVCSSHWCVVVGEPAVELCVDVSAQSCRSAMCRSEWSQQERCLSARSTYRPAGDAGPVERSLRRRWLASTGCLLGVDVPRWTSLWRLGAAGQWRRSGRLWRRPGELNNMLLLLLSL